MMLKIQWKQCLYTVQTADISDPFMEMVVTESNAAIKIYLRPTLVAMVLVTKNWEF